MQICMFTSCVWHVCAELEQDLIYIFSLINVPLFLNKKNNKDPSIYFSL